MRARTLIGVVAVGSILVAAPGCGPGDKPACIPAAEACNGVDDDCDGAVDQGLGDLSCGVGICAVAAPACAGGAQQTCTPGPAEASESCDGEDDDCDGNVDEGCACTDGATQACYGGPAGTAGVGPCRAGQQTCAGGAWGGCEGEQAPVSEACNGVDDDCDGQVDEGDPGGGAACDADVPGACAAGVQRCTGGQLVCVQSALPGPELCNGVDDDCDPATGDAANDSRVGAACDGGDTDLCREGSVACVDGGLACADPTGSTVDLCNGQDDDCDPASADGSEDPQAGAACDGADSDLCQEGTLACANGALVCTDGTASTLDLCNGQDDDCDPASADGSEDPQAGAACDGADSDLCQEGTRACAGGALVCTDPAGSAVDICNGQDDDCDPTSADGSEDPLAGTPCDGPDADACQEGTISCVGGANACSDATAATVEICDNLVDDDCDGATDELDCTPPPP